VNVRVAMAGNGNVRVAGTGICTGIWYAPVSGF